MTIIDQYIEANKERMSPKEMALNLGVSEFMVYSRVRRVQRKQKPGHVRASYDKEIAGLIAFIEERGKGHLVDVAKDRLYFLTGPTSHLLCE